MSKIFELRQLWLVNKIPVLADSYEEAIHLVKEYYKSEQWDFCLNTLEKVVSNNLAGLIILKKDETV